MALFAGSKAAPRPGGIGSAAAGQPGMEGDSMLSKLIPGNAAEQAGKLGDGTYTAAKLIRSMIGIRQSGENGII